MRSSPLAALVALAAALAAPLASVAGAQSPDAAPPPIAEQAAAAARLRHAGGRLAPSVAAVRLTRPVVLDGRLDEAVWQGAGAGDFRQVEPRDGDPASERTEVWVAHDEAALYVAARLHDGEPGAVVGRLARRDAETSSDLFDVAIDSYHDHRTVFRFGVNPAGVRTDGVTANDTDLADASWDPVWDVGTRADSAGWTVEMRIPFSQLHFAGGREATWGINFTRFIQRRGETVRWSWAPNSEPGYASHFGHLTGLGDVPAPRHLELTPYLVARGDYDSAADPRDPFDPGRLHRASAGLDLKYGVTSDLTLVATVNPDFGQVEADPAEVNLSVFESFFEERRPFFVEGANILQFGVGASGSVFGAPQLFYSRRIGRAPSRSVSLPDAWVEEPEATTILGAAKLTGQTHGWSVGVLSALTAREEARVQLADGDRTRTPVEPLGHYGVLSLRRNFRGGRSGVGVMATSVQRERLPEELAFLRRSAHTAGVDFFHRFAGQRYSVGGTASGSWVAGDTLAMLLAQRSSARYFQRPDQDYVSVDSAARGLGGWALSLTGGKVAGAWTWGSDLFAYSPGFEINDAGFQNSADRLFHGVRLTHRWLRPTRWFRSASASLNGSQQWNFGGTRIARGLFPSASVQLHNQWSVYASGNVAFASLNDRVTRGGPLVLVPQQWTLSTTVVSDPRGAVTGSLSADVTENRSGGYSRGLSADVTFRPTTAATISLAPSLRRLHSAAGYVGERADPTATATYGRRYLFGALDQELWDLTVRADWALTPSATLQLHAQPFVSTADYYGHREFVAPGEFRFRDFGRDGQSTIAYDAERDRYTADPDGAGPAAPLSFADPSFRLRSLRTNLVLRWEYRPGSIVYLTWAHGRSTMLDDALFRPTRELGDLLGDEQRNRVTVKMSYWLSR
jgi:hypothetical protein